MIEPNYLPFILIGGGIIFVILFFHYVTILPLAFSQSIRCTHLIDTVILNAHPKCPAIRHRPGND